MSILIDFIDNIFSSISQLNRNEMSTNTVWQLTIKRRRWGECAPVFSISITISAGELLINKSKHISDEIDLIITYESMSVIFFEILKMISHQTRRKLSSQLDEIPSFDSVIIQKINFRTFVYSND